METEYTLDRLLQMRSQWWLRAMAEGKIGAIRTVIRELGEVVQQSDHYAERVVRHGDITFAESAVGRHFTVKIGDRLVAGEWEDFSLYVPGWWERELDKLYSRAAKIMQERERDALEEDRQRLIHELWLDTPLGERQPTHN